MAHLLFLSISELDIHLVGVTSDCRDCTLYMVIFNLMVIGLVYEWDITDGLEHILLDIGPGIYVRVLH